MTGRGLLSRRFATTAAVALALLLSSNRARAEEPPITDVNTARKLFAEAEKDEEAGRWLDVIQKLRRIVAFKETAGVRFHLALAEEHVGQLVAARADYQRAFDLSRNMRDTDGRDVNERSGKSLVDLLKRTPIVTIVGDPEAPNATVSVDGVVDRGATERPFTHDPTEIVVEATAPGRASFRRAEKLAEGAKATITLRLPPSKADGPASPIEPASPIVEPPPPAETRAPSRLPGIAFGVVAVGGIATSVAYAVQYRRLDKANGELCVRADVVCDDRREDVASRHRTIAIVAGGVGLVSAAASVYFFTRGPSTVAVSPTSVSYARTFLASISAGLRRHDRNRG